jgi:hypothetical protein
MDKKLIEKIKDIVEDHLSNIEIDKIIDVKIHMIIIF